MTAQVIFLNFNYWPDQEEVARLENMQDYLTYSNNHYYYERQQYPEEFVKALKEEVHKLARKRLELVTER